MILTNIHQIERPAGSVWYTCGMENEVLMNNCNSFLDETMNLNDLPGLAIGVSIQNSFYIKRDVNDDWDAGHFGSRVRYHYIWRPVAFVRYCKSL